jgi:hypothetical protein
MKNRADFSKIIIIQYLKKYIASSTQGFFGFHENFLDRLKNFSLQVFTSPLKFLKQKGNPNHEISAQGSSRYSGSHLGDVVYE